MQPTFPRTEHSSLNNAVMYYPRTERVFFNRAALNNTHTHTLQVMKLPPFDVSNTVMSLSSSSTPASVLIDVSLFAARSSRASLFFFFFLGRTSRGSI